MIKCSETNNLGLLLLLVCVLVSGCQDSSVNATVNTQTTAASNDGATVTADGAKQETDPLCACETAPAADVSDAGASTVQVETISGGLTFPEDLALIDQSGAEVNVYQDLVRDKLLVMNFIFTTCKGVCPPMGANFALLQKQLGDRLGRQVNLVSVSVDPTIDTPQRLTAWREQFGGGEGWTLLTGSKQDVDYLLKSLQVFSADKNDHSPFVLIGRESTGVWQRVHGLTPADKLTEVIVGMLDEPDGKANQEPASPIDLSAATNQAAGIQEAGIQEAGIQEAGDQVSAAAKYFTDVPLVNQHGEPMRLYSDLLKGKVVVINSFFTSCKGACPRMIATFGDIQEHFKDRLGKDLFLISMTVDPETDTPEKLKVYAEQLDAGPGWYFITGDKADLELALHKIGHATEVRENHSNVFIIGNESTGLWKKAMGLSPPEQIIPIVESVLSDQL